MDMNISPSMLFSDSYDTANEKVAGSNIIVVVVLSVIVVMFYVLAKSLGGGNGAPPPPSDDGVALNVLEIIMWGCLVFLIMINGLQYLFGVDLKASIKKIFAGTPQVDVSIQAHGDEGEKGKDDGEKEKKDEEEKREREEEKEREEEERRRKKEEADEEKRKRSEEEDERKRDEERRREEEAEREQRRAEEDEIRKEKEAEEMRRRKQNEHAIRKRREAAEKAAAAAAKSKETKEKKKEKPGEIQIDRQVFHVPVNKYTYKDARALCGAFGGRLATYNEIEEAYKKGAEWCSYGWSKDQMIYYPTQKKTFGKLQKIKGHENDCGRPGINGGYVSNAEARFGVNCFAPKRGISKREQKYMLSLNTYPQNAEEREFKERVDHYKNNIKKILVAPFNKKTWSAV
jgi:hypothetical protein